MPKSLHTPEYGELCSLLVSIREQGELTQLQVAERLNKPQSFVAKYEGGERRLDIVEFTQVCHALGVSEIETFKKWIGRLTLAD